MGNRVLLGVASSDKRDDGDDGEDEGKNEGPEFSILFEIDWSCSPDGTVQEGLLYRSSTAARMNYPVYVDNAGLAHGAGGILLLTNLGDTDHRAKSDQML